MRFHPRCQLRQPGSADSCSAPLQRPNGKLAGTFEQANEFWHRETDHIPEIAVDPLHKSGASPLDRVAPCTALPFACGDVIGDLLSVQIPEIDLRRGDRRALLAIGA